MSWPNRAAIVVLTLSLPLAAPAAAESLLAFDGVDDCARIPYDPSFPIEVFTAAAWIKAPTPTRRSAIIARGEDDDSWNLVWQLYVNSSGNLEVMLEDSSENNYCYPTACNGAPRCGLFDR